MAGWRTISVVAFAAALLGGAVGASVTLLWRDDDHPPRRGQIVRVGGPDSNRDIATTPWCNDFNHFCIAETSPGKYVALYTFTTHEVFRQQGCAVRWDTTFQFEDPATGRGRSGWFRDPCGGAVFDVSGHRVFGPAPRDLDQFPLKLENGEFLVDTRTLLCGASPRPQPCPRAPAPQ